MFRTHPKSPALLLDHCKISLWDSPADRGEKSMDNPFALIIEDDTKSAVIFSEALRQADFETEIVLDG